MSTTLTRSSRSVRRAGFAETQFVLGIDDADYSGFAPTQVFTDTDAASARLPVRSAARAAGTRARSAATRAAAAPCARAAAQDSVTPASWVSARWVAAQEARAHGAALRARALSAAPRPDVAPALASSALAADRLAVRPLVRGLLPLCAGVAVTVALISAVLPLLDRL